MKVGPILVLAVATSLGGCLGNDELHRYAQRKDTVTLSAGDAKEVNARTHMLAQWPEGVGDRRIPMQGTRAARAMECYREGAKKTQQATGGQSGGSGGGGGIQISMNTGAGSAGSGKGSECP